MPVLKVTNCAGSFLKPVYRCYLTRDLARLAGVSINSGTRSGVPALDHIFNRFTPELLPEKAARAQPESAAQVWKLDPFWLRGDWCLAVRTRKRVSDVLENR